MRLSMSPFTALRSAPLPVRTMPQALSLRNASTSASPDIESGPVLSGNESAGELRIKAIKLYKELHRLGRDYPDPNYEFNKRLRRAFEKNSKTTDLAALQKQLELGEHIKKEVLALISLKKFRHLRRSYHANEGPR